VPLVETVADTVLDTDTLAVGVETAEGDDETELDKVSEVVAVTLLLAIDDEDGEDLGV
jgi:hypothetical protein